jgi:YD repeat-containing protein
MNCSFNPHFDRLAKSENRSRLLNAGSSSLATLLVALTCQLVSQPAQALVDMKEANLNESFLDVIVQGAAYPLRVQRYYNSRSTFNGIFGFGWCSDVETNVEKTPEGGIKIQECGDGKQVVYRAEKFDKKSIDTSVDALIEQYKKKNATSNAEAISFVREQLRADAGMRVEYAKTFSVAIPEAQKGVVYKAEGLDVEKVVFDGQLYTRTLADGSSQKFDARGRVVAFHDKTSYLQIKWGADNLVEVVDSKGKKLNFAFSGKRVKEITGPNNIKVEYKHNKEDLVEVKNMWGNTYKFDYDGNHNLTKIAYPDGHARAMTYNAKQDWVTSHTDLYADGKSCTEAYEYNYDPHSRDHYWSTAVKKCGTEVKNSAKFEFWHSKTADGKKYLSRVATKSLVDSLDVSYHPEFGRPLTVKRNGNTTTFEYYASGLVKRKDTASARMFFTYGTENSKVSKVSTEFVDSKGKIAKKRETSFAYDSKGNLTRANNSEGQTINLSYDERGRIASILDQAKKEVLIQYEERTGKPAIITRPKVGTINISYKPNGDILKVDSKDGPSVAVQIASTFNNLLDIISPATSELEL